MNTRPIFLLVFVVVLLPFLSTGCVSAHRRAHERFAAFGQLTRDDQRLVLHRRVHAGMDKDAVYIAWGAPDRVAADGASKRAHETWIYERQILVYAPTGSYDRVPYPPTGMYGLAAGGPGVPPGFGYGGVPNTGFPYPPHVNVADLVVKRAEFIDGRLVRYETRRGGWQVDARANASKFRTLRLNDLHKIKSENGIALSNSQKLDV